MHVLVECEHIARRMTDPRIAVAPITGKTGPNHLRLVKPVRGVHQ
jgi:hypothetical protein